MVAAWCSLTILSNSVHLAAAAGVFTWPPVVTFALLHAAEPPILFATMPLGMAAMALLPQPWIPLQYRTLDSLLRAHGGMFAAMDDPVLALDEAGRIIDFNAAAEQALGLSASTAQRTPIQDLLHRCLGDLRTAAVERGRVSAQLLLTVEDQGETRCYDVRVSSLSLSSGCVNGYLVMLHDMTEVKRTEEALRMANATAEAALRKEKQRRLETEQREEIAESLRDMLSTLNSRRPLEAVLRYIVCQVRDLLGSEAAAIYGLAHRLGSPHARIRMETLTLQAACDLRMSYQVNSPLPFAHAAVRRALATRWPVAVQHQCVPSADVGRGKGRKATESAFPMQADNLPGGYRALLVVPLVIRDEIYGCLFLFYSTPCHFGPEDMAMAMTCADQMALVIDNARLQAQIERDAIDAERRRLARELHDTVSQEIFSASLLSENIPRLWHKHRREAEQGLKQLQRLTSGALAALRVLLLERRPATLDKMPLADLLRQLAEAMSLRASVHIQMQIAGEEIPLPTEVKLAFYRVAREALTNAIKHARAHMITVRLLVRRTGTSALEIADDGQGFDPGAVPLGHYGLSMMREHARTVGTIVHIKSRVGYGTQVIMEWRRSRAKSALDREEAANAPASADPRRDC